MAVAETDPERLRARIDALPGLEPLRAAAKGLNPHLVGGAVRDLMLGTERADLDVVVTGDALELARRLDPEATLHERFGTATVRAGELTLDLAGARAETYGRPGALPEVRPGTLPEDLARRDFTVNAMAAALDGPAALVDPHGGAGDLAAGLLRVLHERSFADDPTRALRAARYAARLGFSLEAETESLLRESDLTAVSFQRIEADLRRIAAEQRAAAALALLGEWGVLDIPAERVRLAEGALDLLAAPPWRGVATRGDAVIAIAGGDLAIPRELAETEPGSPSEGVAMAHGHGGTDLVLARALGAEWLDRYLEEWRAVRLEIAGGDLLEAGVSEGPAVGRGLAAALRARLDGEAATRDDQLRVALEAAGGG